MFEHVPSSIRPRNSERVKERSLKLFWQKVNKTNGNDCWIWTGNGLIGKGYGRAKFCGYEVLAHRLSFFLHYGFLPPNKCVCHSCDNMLCVNPAHLFLGTIKENNKDMIKKKRHAYGEKNGASKLTEDMVVQIKKATREGKITQRKLAEKFNISQTQISVIKTGKTWKHLQ